jgi:hypothetical protein
LTPACIFPLLLGAIGLLHLFFGETLRVNHGLGWDGLTYAGMARDFPALVSEGRLSPYFLVRVFPCAVIHYVLQLFDLPLTDRNILWNWRLLNLLLLVASGFFWARIVGEMKLTPRGQWFSGLLFCNFFALKWYFYYPVLTDQTAFFLGLCMLDAYLKGKSGRLLLASVLCGFTWPFGLYGGLLLYLWPREKTEPLGLGKISRPLAALMAVTFSGAAAHMVFSVGFKIGPSSYVAFNQSTVVLSLAGLAAYLYFGSLPLLGHPGFSRPLEIFKGLHWSRCLVAISVLAVDTYLFSLCRGSSVTFLAVGKGIFISAIHRPLFFLVILAVFYGPMVLAGIFLWPKIARQVNACGFGLTLYVLTGLFLSVSDEARKVIIFFPFVLLFVFKICDDEKWPIPRLYFLAVLSLIYSKVWFWINVAPFTGDLQRYPDQYYAMNTGWAMNNPMYITQGSIVLLTAAVLYFLLFRRPNRE